MARYKRPLSYILILTLAVGVWSGVLPWIPSTAPLEIEAALPTPVQGDYNDGIDFSTNEGGLASPDARIYFGSYDHAVSPLNANGLAVKEGTKRPILWRVMGEENGDGKLTLMSEWVLDSMKFHDSSNSWETSTVRAYLNGSFMSSFSSTELVQIPSTNVKTSQYKYNTTVYDGLKSTTSDRVWLPWGTYDSGTHADKNKIWAGANDEPIGSAELGMGNGNADKIAYLRGKTTATYWWLRSPISANGTYALYASTSGQVDYYSVPDEIGLRPALKLNLSSVIYASEVEKTPALGGTAVDDNYVAAESGKKNYKLTVVSGAGVGSFSGMKYGSTAVNSGSTVDMFRTLRNQMVPLSGISASAGAGLNLNGGTDTGGTAYDAFSLSYKIVGTTGGGLRRVLSAGQTTTNLTATANTLALNTNGLVDGSYDVYVWLQKNNTISSDESTAPTRFTMNLVTAPEVKDVKPSGSAVAAKTTCVAITFDQPMKTSGVGTLTSDKLSFGSQSWSGDKKTVTIPIDTPSPLAHNATYSLTISAFENVTGAAMLDDVGHSFTTEDIPTPEILTQPALCLVTYGSIVPDLSVGVTNGGIGTLSYQWYDTGTTASTTGGLLVGTDSPTYTPPTPVTGVTKYYYVKITSTEGTVSKTAISDAVAVGLIPKPLTLDMIGDIPTVTYAGVGLTPEPDLLYVAAGLSGGQELLSKNGDYVITYLSNINAGTASAIFTATTGAGANYTGSAIKEFTILPKPITSDMVNDPSAQSFTYSGSAYEPVMSVSFGAIVLDLGQDYTIAYADNTAAGINTAKVTITASTGALSNYTGSVLKTFTIDPRDLDAGMITLSAVTYTGIAVSPAAFAVSFGAVVLTQGVDFTLALSDNILASIGTATAAITAVVGGNYTGSAIKSYDIHKRDLAEVDMNDFADEQFTGSDIKPDVSVSYSGIMLTKDTDYTVTYTDNRSMGTATVQIDATTGAGANFIGSQSKTFDIIAKTLTDDMIADIPAVTYSALAHEPKPAVTFNTSASGLLTLTEGVDYTITYTDNIEAGTASAIFTATSGAGTNYSGSIVKNFTILPKDITDSMATDLSAQSFTYSGSAHTPAVAVTYGSIGLSLGTDYTVSYTTNTAAGTAGAVVTGLGNYTGSAVKPFRILPKSLEDAMIHDMNPVTYTGIAITPGQFTVTFGALTLAEVVDYTALYTDNIAAGIATAAITAVNGGNYTGTASKQYTINKRPLVETSIHGVNPTYEYTGSQITPISGVSFGAVGLAQGVDYTITYTDNTAVGTASAMITAVSGAGANYTGTHSKDFAITYKTITEDMIAGIPNQVYTGSPIEPVIVASHGSIGLVIGQDYEVSYTTNTAVGTAGAVISAKAGSNYTGSIVKTFNITKDNSLTVTSPGIIMHKAGRPLEYTFDLSSLALNKSDHGTITYSIGSITDTNHVLSGSAVISGNTLEYAIKETAAVGNTVSIPIIIHTDNYADIVATLSIGFEGRATVVVSGIEIEDKIYDGQPVVISGTAIAMLAGTDVTASMSGFTYWYIATDGRAYAYSVPPTDAGSYQLRLSVVNTDQDYEGYVNIPFTIERKQIEDSMVSDIADQVFNDTSIWPTVSAIDGATTLVMDTDYQLSHENNTSVGTASAIISGLGNYTGTVRKDFAITKGTGLVATYPGVIYARAGESSTFDLNTIIYNKIYTGTKAYGMTNIIDGSSALAGPPDMTGHTLTYTIVSGAVDGNTITLEVGIQSQNYEDATVLLTIQVTDKEIAVIGGNLKVENKIYDGDPAMTSGAIAVVVGGVDITASLSGLYWHYVGTDTAGVPYDSDQPPTNAGSYALVVSVIDADGNYIGNAVLPFDIVGDLTIPFNIDRKPLFIIAEDYIVNIGDPLPSLTYRVEGLVQGQNLLVGPAITTIINDTSQPGTYPIKARGAQASPNYAIQYVDGKLQVGSTETNTNTNTGGGNSKPSKIDTGAISISIDIAVDVSVNVDVDVEAQIGTSTATKTYEKKIPLSTIDTAKDGFVIHVDAAALVAEGALKSGQTLDNIAVTMPVKVLNQIQSRVSGATSAKPFYLELSTDYGKYRVPVNMAEITVNLPELLTNNHLSSNEISFRLVMNDKSEDEALKDSMPSGYMADHLVEYKILIVENRNGKVLGEAKRFTTNLTRLIPMSKTQGHKTQGDGSGVFITDQSKWGGMRYDETQKTFVFTPHKAVYIDGIWYADISINQNSTYGVFASDMRFSDVSKSHWAETYIQTAAAKKLVQGMGGAGQGTYAPEKSLTRAEFVQMIENALHLPAYPEGIVTDSAIAYNDVKEGSWYYKSIMKARASGLLDGMSQTAFAPDKAITREEMASIIAGAMKYKGDQTQEATQAAQGTTGPQAGFAGKDIASIFKDYKTISQEARADVQTVYNQNIMTGMKDDVFQPKGLSTRAQAATVLINMVRAMELID